MHVHSRNIMEFYVSMGFLHEIHEKYIRNCMRHGQNHLSTTSQPIVHNTLWLLEKYRSFLGAPETSFELIVALQPAQLQSPVLQLSCTGMFA